MGSFSSSSHDRFLFETCFLLASEAFLDNLLFFRRPSNAGASNSSNRGDQGEILAFLAIQLEQLSAL